MIPYKDRVGGICLHVRHGCLGGANYVTDLVSSDMNILDINPFPWLTIESVAITIPKRSILLVRILHIIFSMFIHLTNRSWAIFFKS